MTISSWCPRLALLLVAPLVAAQAQIRRPSARQAEPPTWVGLSIGLLQPSTIVDGTTGTEWDFGSAVQYRVSVEQRVGYGGSVGLAGGFSTAPLLYRNFGGTAAGCAIACDAEVDVTQVLATFRSSGQLGFHQVFELGAGATAFSNFRRTDTDDRIGPGGSDFDLTLMIGGGFGFGLTPTTQIQIVQDVGIVVHQRTNLSGNQSSVGRFYVTRVGGRVGFF